MPEMLQLMIAPFVASMVLVAMLEVFQAPQIVEVPADRGVLAVDLEGVQGLVASGVAGRFEVAQRTVSEAAEEGARVVDADGLALAGLGVDAFLDERFGHRRDVSNTTVQPDRRVDAMRQQVAGHTGARFLGIKTP